MRRLYRGAVGVGRDRGWQLLLVAGGAAAVWIFADALIECYNRPVEPEPVFAIR